MGDLRRRRAPLCAVIAIAATTLSMGLTGVARADTTSSPSASPTSAPTSPSAEPTASPDPGEPTPSSPTTDPEPSAVVHWDLPAAVEVSAGSALVAHGTVSGTSTVGDVRLLASDGTEIARTTPDADGAFTFTIPTSTVGSRTYQAQLANSTAVSGLSTVTVAPAITWSLPSSVNAEALSRVTARGKVYGVPLPASVELIKGSAAVRPVPVSADGSYATDLPTNRTGVATYAVRASSLGLTSSATTMHVNVHLTLRSRPATTGDVRYSYRRGCPVGPSQLRVYTFRYVAWNGVIQTGTLIARSTQTAIVTDVFGSALRVGYRFRQIRTADAFRGSDSTMMAADDTSAFNCRRVTGNPYALSPHSYGTAYDINTVENPYQDYTGRWWPSSFGQVYRSRSTARLGMLYARSAVVQAFVRHRVGWGAGWSKPDYQHFDPSAPRGGFTGYARAPRNGANVVR